MASLLSNLSDKAIELVIAAVVITLLAIGRVVFSSERKAFNKKETHSAAHYETIIEKLEAMDRANAQRMDSMRRETIRQIADAEKETQRQFERLHDRFNQM